MSSQGKRLLAAFSGALDLRSVSGHATTRATGAHFLFVVVYSVTCYSRAAR